MSRMSCIIVKIQYRTCLLYIGHVLNILWLCTLYNVYIEGGPGSMSAIPAQGFQLFITIDNNYAYM